MIKYPIAETFTNIQGEGTYAGTWMFFIRLAGCNVGKFERPSEMDDLELGKLRVFNSNHSICTNLQGEKFLCDTDYFKRYEFTAEELLSQLAVSGAKHVCITGGEPFIHELNELVYDIASALPHRDHLPVHIETSGTKPIDHYTSDLAWITCSPKEGFCQYLLLDDAVSEWKFVVGPKTDERFIREFVDQDAWDRPVFIQPIGDIHSHLKENMARCIELIRRNPTWRLSAQLHKWVGGR